MLRFIIIDMYNEGFIQSVVLGVAEDVVYLGFVFCDVLEFRGTLNVFCDANVYSMLHRWHAVIEPTR